VTEVQAVLKQLSTVVREDVGVKFEAPNPSPLIVNIEPGMRPGEILVFPKECSDDPNYIEPGDVHLVLQEADGDEGWTRKGDDLYTEVRIGLGESLMGCKKSLKGHPGYPDGLEIDLPCGTQNGETLKFMDKGFIKKGKQGYGILYCKVNITVSDKDKEILARNEPLLKAMFN
jgi:DnaJ-class molecular chaperone